MRAPLTLAAILMLLTFQPALAGTWQQPEIADPDGDETWLWADIRKAWIIEDTALRFTIYTGNSSSNEATSATVQKEVHGMEWAFGFKALGSDWRITTKVQSELVPKVTRDGELIKANVTSDRPFFEISQIHQGIRISWNDYAELLPPATNLTDFYAFSRSLIRAEENTLECRSVQVMDCAPDSGNVNATFTLAGDVPTENPDLFLTAIHRLSTIQQGQETTFELTATNRADRTRSHTYGFTAPADWAISFDQTTSTLKNSSKETRILTVRAPIDAPPGDHTIVATVSNEFGHDQVPLTVRITTPPAPPTPAKPSMEIPGPMPTLQQGEERIINLALRNDGELPARLLISFEGDRPTWMQVYDTRPVVQGGRSLNVPVVLSIPSNAEGGFYQMAVRVTDADTNEKIGLWSYLLTVSEIPEPRPPLTNGKPAVVDDDTDRKDRSLPLPAPALGLLLVLGMLAVLRRRR